MIQFAPVPIAVGKQVNVTARNWMPNLLYNFEIRLLVYNTKIVGNSILNPAFKSYSYMYKLHIYIVLAKRFWVKWLKIASSLFCISSASTGVCDWIYLRKHNYKENKSLK